MPTWTLGAQSLGVEEGDVDMDLGGPEPWGGAEFQGVGPSRIPFGKMTLIFELPAHHVHQPSQTSDCHNNLIPKKKPQDPFLALNISVKDLIPCTSDMSVSLTTPTFRLLTRHGSSTRPNVGLPQLAGIQFLALGNSVKYLIIRHATIPWFNNQAKRRATTKKLQDPIPCTR